MPQLKCPTCEKSFDMAESKALPFCSERCRKIDLGRWLRETYTFPALRVDEEDDEENPRAVDSDEN